MSRALEVSRARWGGGLIAISDRHSLRPGTLVSWARSLADLGVETLWLREKDLGDRALLHLATELRQALPPPFRLLLSARPDLALASGADGVHLPAEGLPTAEVKRRWPGLIVGRSTHEREEVERARDEGADYVTFGPVYPTPSKAEILEPRGLERLSAAAGTGLPVFALGGVRLELLPEILAAGAEGFAAIRFFFFDQGLGERVARARELLLAACNPGGAP